MSRKSIAIFTITLLCVTLAGSVAAQSEKPDGVDAAVSATFTYQGQLRQGGAAVNGSCDMAFRLYDDPGGGNLIGSPITTTQSINNGLFTVGLNFGSNAFQGAARWLNIRVRCPASSGSYTTLTPRQQITAAPYALAPWVTSSNNLYYTAGSVGIGTTNPSASLSVAPSGATEPSAFGFPTGLKVGTASGTIPLAVRQNADESATPALAVFETSNGPVGDFGANASTFVVGAAASHGLGFNVDGSIRAMTVLANGAVGIGTIPCANARLHVYTGDSGGNCRDAAVRGESSLGNGVYGSSFAREGVYGSSSESDGVHGSSTAGSGVYGSSVDNTGVYGQSTNSTGVFGGSTGGSFLFEGMDLAAHNRRFVVERATGNVKADGAFTSPADFAEMMTVTGLTDDYTPGDVLVIGRDGKLSLSNEPYAANLAGVYSAKPGFLGDTEIGAHGIESYDLPPTQERIAVALLGIVPVKVTADNGPIQPGDLLTTSSTPGHAMKAKPVVIDGVAIYPTGTILGKALESWEQGTGVIQVLITLR